MSHKFQLYGKVFSVRGLKAILGIQYAIVVLFLKIDLLRGQLDPVNYTGAQYLRRR